MKITKIRISSFGKLRDYTAAFGDNLTCIERENEFGKSTILAFIRAMFYGFPPKSTPNVKEYSRGKYTPWGTKGFGGSISFRHEGREYILERTFFARKSEDQISLRDSKSGAQVEPGDKEIGELLFDIGEAEFVNTVFVGQLSSGFPATGRNTETVSERLANLAATGSETYSFDTADKNLKEASAALLALRGDGGRIRELERERDGLLEEELYIDEQMRLLNEVDSRIDILNRKCDALRADEQQPAASKRAALRIQIEEAGKRQRAIESTRIEKLERQKFLSEIIFRHQEHEKTRQRESQRRADYIRQIEAESLQTGKELSEAISMEEKCIKDYATQLSTLEERQNEVSNALLAAEGSRRTKEQALSALLTEIRGASEISVSSSESAGEISKYRRRVLLSMAIVAVLLIIAIAGGVFAALLNRPQLMWTLMLISPAGGIFFLTYFAVARRRKANMKHHITMEQHSAQLEQCRRESFDAAGKEQDLRMQLENLRTQSESARQRETLEREHYREKRDSLMTRIESLSARLANIRADEKTPDYGENTGNRQEISDASDPLDQSSPVDQADPKDPNEEQNLLSEEIKFVDGEARETDSLIRALLEEDKSVKTLEDAASDSIATYREEIARLSGGREKIESQIPARSEIEERISLIEERIERARAYHRSLQIAGEAMKQASGEMERIFAPRVNELAGEYLSLLTGGRYRSLRFDRDFHVEIATEDDVSFRNSDFFSGGTIDQIYLSLRLAISDLIHPEGDKMPLLLDDALVQYDDERAKRAVRLLVTLSARRQIIMFTCHKHTSERIRDAEGDMGTA